MMMMTLVMVSYHWSLSVPGHIGDDHDVARADPELRQQLFHLLRLHPCLIIMIFVPLIMMIVMIIVIIVLMIMIIF